MAAPATLATTPRMEKIPAPIIPPTPMLMAATSPISLRGERDSPVDPDDPLTGGPVPSCGDSTDVDATDAGLLRGAQLHLGRAHQCGRSDGAVGPRTPHADRQSAFG